MKKRRDYQNVNLCIRYENFNLSCHDPCHLLSFSNLDPSAYASDSDRHAEKSSSWVGRELFITQEKSTTHSNNKQILKIQFGTYD